jgi:hypothetical protein
MARNMEYEYIGVKKAAGTKALLRRAQQIVRGKYGEEIQLDILVHAAIAEMIERAERKAGKRLEAKP